METIQAVPTASAVERSAGRPPVVSIPLVSIVVPCKGRLHHLQQTLPTMLAQQCPFEFEVVVVDYSCPQQTHAWCKSLNLRRLTSVRVDVEQDELNLSRARNCGASVAAGRALAFVDADIRLDSSWLAVASAGVLDGRAGLVRAYFDARNGWDRGGTCIVARSLYRRVRAYDEGFPPGWGAEDIDFYRRCRRHAHEMTFPGSLLGPIKHRHDERTSFYAAKDIFAGGAAKGDYLRQRNGPVNPNGYGEGVAETFRGALAVSPHDGWTRRKRHSRPLRRRAT